MQTLFRNLMKLRRWLEQYWGLDYSKPNSDPFHGEHFQTRDYTLRGASILEVMLESGLVKSKTEAKRALQAGAIRIGLGDQWTPFRECKKLIQDRQLEPNDLIRLGKRAFRIVPRKPALWEQLCYSFSTFAEEAGRICNTTLTGYRRHLTRLIDAS